MKQALLWKLNSIAKRLKHRKIPDVGVSRCPAVMELMKVLIEIVDVTALRARQNDLVDEVGSVPLEPFKLQPGDVTDEDYEDMLNEGILICKKTLKGKYKIF